MATFNYNKSFEDYLKDYYEQQKALQEYQKNKPGEYKSQYQGYINDYMGRIANRKPFQYDPNSDALYQQYRNEYTDLGRLAMQDTMGQAAQLTGGYGNSYANMVGQQAYQGYMRQLADKIPELSEMAYKRYAQEGQDLKDALVMYQNADESAYGRYRDNVGDFYTQLNYLAGQADKAYSRGSDRYNTDYSNAYNMYRAQAADEQAAAQLAWDKEQYARNEAFKREQYEYQKQLDAEANAQAWAKINAKKSGSDDESGGKKNVKVKYTGGASNEKVSSADEEYVRKAIAFNKKMPEETRMKAAADLIEELKAQGYSQSAAEQLVAYYYDK